MTGEVDYNFSCRDSNVGLILNDLIKRVLTLEKKFAKTKDGEKK